MNPAARAYGAAKKFFGLGSGNEPPTFATAFLEALEAAKVASIGTPQQAGLTCSEDIQSQIWAPLYKFDKANEGFSGTNPLLAQETSAAAGGLEAFLARETLHSSGVCKIWNQQSASTLLLAVRLYHKLSEYANIVYATAKADAASAMPGLERLAFRINDVVRSSMFSPDGSTWVPSGLLLPAGAFSRSVVPPNACTIVYLAQCGGFVVKWGLTCRIAAREDAELLLRSTPLLRSPHSGNWEARLPWVYIRPSLRLE